MFCCLVSERNLPAIIPRRLRPTCRDIHDTLRKKIINRHKRANVHSICIFSIRTYSHLVGGGSTWKFECKAFFQEHCLNENKQCFRNNIFIFCHRVQYTTYEKLYMLQRTMIHMNSARHTFNKMAPNCPVRSEKFPFQPLLVLVTYLMYDILQVVDYSTFFDLLHF